MHVRTGDSKQNKPRCGKFKHNWYVTNCTKNSKTSYTIHLACKNCPSTTTRQSNQAIELGGDYGLKSTF